MAYRAKAPLHKYIKYGILLMSTNEREKEIIKEALERFKQAEEAQNEFRRNVREDLEFISDNQWDPLARQERTQSSRPCFTVDRLNPMLRQIVNEERQNRPAIQVNPTSGGATEDIADILAGMIRHIEQDSSAESAYDKAGWYAAATGIGYIRIRTDYEHEETFDQKLYIEDISDPLSVFYDTMSVDIDGHDANWAFIVTNMDKEDFIHKYPDSKTVEGVNEVGWHYFSADEPDWYTEDTIRIAEYFYKDYTKETLYQLQDNLTGEVFTTTELPNKKLIRKDGQLPVFDTFGNELPSFTILQQRPTHTVKVKHCLLTCNEILMETEFAVPHIPIVPVYGEDYFIDGKRFTCGAVRRAKDAQKALNFATSLQLELIDLNAKAPYIGAVGQFDTFEDEWGNANRKNFGFLQYNAIDINGNPIAPPQRNIAEAPIQGAQAVKAQAVDDIKSVFGVFDAALGASGNETSGVAILARKQQSGISNYHYYDNLVRSVKRIGRILVDAIPAYYDTPRMVRIIKPNGNQDVIAINQINKFGKMLDLSMGRYDVDIQTGPTYSTRRQEAVEGLSTLIGAQPQLLQVIGDLAVQEMDWPMAKQAADRIRATIPPEILQATEEGDLNAEDQLPMVRAQLQKSQRNLEALNAHAAQVEQELKTTQDELKLTKMKQDVEMRKAEMENNVKNKDLELKEQSTELDFLVKEQELIIQREQLELEKAKLQIAGVEVMSDINNKMFDREATRFDAVDSAQPSDMKAPASGMPG